MLLETTKSLCPDCHEVVEAEIHRSNGDLYMTKQCEEHGDFKSLYWKDAELYQYIYDNMPKENICEDPVCIKYEPCTRHFDKSTTVMLHITDRCNYACPICFAKANEEKFKEPTVEDIRNALPDTDRKDKPGIVLIGGEPTLRKDLPHIVRAIRGKGYYPRLATNGTGLMNEEFLLELKEAGLEWIILQFDGFSDDIHKELRGKELLQFKGELLDLLNKHDFKVHLAVMAKKGVNLAAAGDIVKYAFTRREIIWISFYPSTEIHRNNLNGGDTHAIDVIEALDKGTDGSIKRKDFLDMVKGMNFLHKYIKAKLFRTKISTIPTLLVSDSKGFFPVTRLLNPLFALKKLPVVVGLIKDFPRIMGFQKTHPPKNVLFVVIEKFHNYKDIDFKEASNCHMCYMIKDGFVAYDTFNSMYRERKLW